MRPGRAPDPRDRSSGPAVGGRRRAVAGVLLGAGRGRCSTPGAQSAARRSPRSPARSSPSSAPTGWRRPPPSTRRSPCSPWPWAEGDGIGSETSRVVTVGFAAPVDAAGRRLPGVGGVRRSRREPGPGPRSRRKDGEASGGTVETSTDGAALDGGGRDRGHPRRRLAAHHRARSGGADPGQGLWVEAQIGDDAGTVDRSRRCSRSTRCWGATPQGRCRPRPSAPPPRARRSWPIRWPSPDPPPTLTVDDHLTVTETEPVPATPRPANRS